MKLGKEFKIGFVLMSVCYLALGVVLLFYPEFSQQMLCYVLGAITVVYGLVHIVTYFARTEFEEIYRLDLTTGIVMTGAGLYVIANSVSVANILHVLVGCAILLDSLVKLQNAIDLKRLSSRIWASVLALSILTSVLGAVLVWRTEYLWFSPTQYFGVCLIVDGCVNVWSFLFLSINLNKLRKSLRAQQEAQAADAPVGAETQASPEATEPTDGVSPASEAPATAPAGEEAAVSLDSTVDAAQPRAARRFRLPQIFRPAEDDAEEIAGSIRAALSSSPQSAPENAAAEAPAQDTAPLPAPAEAAAQAPAPEAAPGADRPV